MSQSVKAIENPGIGGSASLIREYYELTKPKVVALIIFTALVGMFLATPGMVPLRTLVFATLGIGLAASAGAAVNQVVEQRLDALMSRTNRRPLPSGRVESRDALLFSIFLAVLAMLVLVTQVNLLTAVLTFLSMIGYAIFYTLFLKRATPQNIVIGGAAGATPPVLGWTAVTGSVDGYALLLFLIIFTWTPPHFWALAIHRSDDYAKADLPMLPVTHGHQFTRLHVLLYTILMVLVSFLPYLTLMSGLLYLVSAALLGAVFLVYAVRLYRDPDPALPMKTFGYSIIYLMGIFTALLFDHYL